MDTYDVTLEIPPTPGKPAAAPSDAVLAPFRVWVNQETPRQKKTPEWRSYPSKEGATLELEPDGRWRCVLGGARVFGKFEIDRKVSQWTVSRTLRCSSDGWATYVEGLVRVAYDPEGKRVHTDPLAALRLNDVVAGQPRETVVVLDAGGAQEAPAH
jgi:hypothetical protein